MKPYYEQDGITIFNADCRDVLPTIASCDLLLTDPPYGISERTDRKARKRTALAGCNDFPPVYGDDEVYDPTPVLAFPRLVLFGANHFADRLPPSPSWIVWDKRAGLMSKRGDAFNDNGDAEMAWTNLGGPVRVISHLWMGMLKASERDERRVHPTQKPVALFHRIIAEHTRPGDLILDPYMGSGPIAAACRNTGRRYIGIEVSEVYCEVAVQRLQQSVLDLGGVTARRQGGQR